VVTTLECDEHLAATTSSVMVAPRITAGRPEAEGQFAKGLKGSSQILSS
jgi:hypothetical protein